PRKLEEERPVDRPLARDRPEAHEIREQGQLVRLAVDPVAMPDLAVAVPIRGVGELERNVWLAVDPVELWPPLEHGLHRLLADERRQEIAEQHPLVVPHERAASL